MRYRFCLLHLPAASLLHANAGHLDVGRTWLIRQAHDHQAVPGRSSGACPESIGTGKLALLAIVMASP
jgi:hypothetical protein